jgi:cytochrome oxidase assembly protein ShyY1
MFLNNLVSCKCTVLYFVTESRRYLGIRQAVEDTVFWSVVPFSVVDTGEFLLLY